MREGGPHGYEETNEEKHPKEHQEVEQVIGSLERLATQTIEWPYT